MKATVSLSHTNQLAKQTQKTQQVARQRSLNERQFSHQKQSRNILPREGSQTSKNLVNQTNILSENLGDEDKEISDGPNKPNIVGTSNGVTLSSVYTQHNYRSTFSPLTKSQTRNQDLLIAEPTLIEDEEEMVELLEAKPLKTDIIERKLTGGFSKYQFDCKPISKRMKSQTQEQIKDQSKSRVEQGCKYQSPTNTSSQKLINQKQKHKTTLQSPKVRSSEKVKLTQNEFQIQNQIQLHLKQHKPNQQSTLEQTSTADTSHKPLTNDTLQTMSRDTFQRINNSTTLSKQPIQSISLSQIQFRKKEYGSPEDKMQAYNFVQPPLSKHQKKSIPEQDQELSHEESLCVTEENRYENSINPGKLANLSWFDNQKLSKCIRHQVQQEQSGQIDLGDYFGGIDAQDIDQAFFSIELLRHQRESIKRKSSGGAGLFSWGSNSLMDMQLKTMKGNRKNQMLLSTGDLRFGAPGPIGFENLSSESDSDIDEADKFVKKTMKNQLLKKTETQIKQSGEKNLLLQDDDEEEDYNGRTPKVLSSEEDDEEVILGTQSKNESSKTNIVNQKYSIEEIKEYQSNQLFHVPQHIDFSQINSHQQLQDKFVHIVESLDKEVIRETKSNRTLTSNIMPTHNGIPTHRQYDSDIFVMSNTTFEEDLTNKSSKRNSNDNKTYRNELQYFVNSSQDMKKLGSTFSKQANSITQHFNNFKNSKELPPSSRRHQKYQHHQHQKPQSKIQGKNEIPFKNRETPSVHASQSMMANQTMVSTHFNQQSIVGPQRKQSSVTKFSNYMSVSNNMTPTPIQKTQVKMNDSKIQPIKIKLNSQYNSISSFHNGNSVLNSKHSPQNAVLNNTNILNNSGHQSILSNIPLYPQAPSQSTNFKIGRSNSNEAMQNFLISSAIQPPQILKGHHSPQSSLFMRPNLSPAPTYKMKERNSMFDSCNPNSQDLHLNSKFVMLKPNQFCSTANESVVGKKKISMGTSQRGSFSKNSNKNLQDKKLNQTLGNCLPKSSFGQDRQEKKTGKARVNEGEKERKQMFQKSCIIDTSQCSNQLATFKLMASIKQNLITKKSSKGNRLKEQRSVDKIQNEQYNSGEGIPRERSKSEVEALIDFGGQVISPINQKEKAEDITCVIVEDKSQNLSPSRSMKSIGQPYQGKTMATMNKFSEDRAGCRSVMTKKLGIQLDNPNNYFKPQKDIAIIDPNSSLSQTYDFSQNPQLQQNLQNLYIPSPQFNFTGKHQKLNFNQSASNSPQAQFCTKIPYPYQPVQQKQSVRDSYHTQSLEFQPKILGGSVHVSKQYEQNMILKNKVQKSPCKKSMMTLNSSVVGPLSTSVQNMSLIAQANQGGVKYAALSETLQRKLQ